MAKGIKTGGRDFQPGNKFGQGRPKQPDDVKLMIAEVQRMRNAARHDFQRCYDKMREWSLADLQVYVKRNDVAVIELVVARFFLAVMSKSKAFEVSTLQELMCGPESKQLELSGPGGEPLNPASKLTPEQIIAAYAEVDRIIREKEQCSSTPTPPPSSESSAPSPPPQSGTES